MEFSSGVDRWMPRDEVVRLVSEWSDLGVTVWLDGGWAVDAVLGVETRPHGDLDVVVVDVDVPRMVAHLNACGYVTVDDADARPWNFVMQDAVGHVVDLHVISRNQAGDGLYGPAERGAVYPVESLTGWGQLGGHPVRCITPQWLMRFHTGYPVRPVDVADVLALHRRFGIALPPEYWLGDDGEGGERT